MHKHASRLPVEKLRRLKPVVRRNKFKHTRRRKRAVHQRRCSFCNTQHLADGTIAFIGITACAHCLCEDSTADFRALLELAQESYHQNFGGRI